MLPPSLEILNASVNMFTGGIPKEWGSLTNMKQLIMSSCGLDGAVCSVIPAKNSVETLEKRIKPEKFVRP